MNQIPKSLENKIKSCAKHYALANKEYHEILHWLFDNNYNEALNDMLIDTCQVGNYPETFISFLNGKPDQDGTTIEDFVGRETDDYDKYA